MNSSFFLVLVAAAIGFFMLFRKFRFQQDNKDTKSSSLSPTSPPSSSLSPTSPPSSSLSQICTHHVFPSFHGADVRKTFLSHIMETFRRKGINSFIDNHIERSKSIGPELVKAIRGSKIAIILLSKNYASSSWCLDELAEIMKCREELGQIVMTIFYEVDPTDVKKQTGHFGKAFRKTCKGKTKEHIEKWRKALENVAQIAGEHSSKWDDEAAMIEKIATDVSNMLNSSIPSRDFDGLVGMRAHMKRMELLLRLDLDEGRMIGIWGPPGIGKTTIARFLYNQFSSSFQLGAIMVNIKASYQKPCLDEYSAQLQLQNQMLDQIINHKGKMISQLGVAQERLKDKKVLLVLDDVDQLGQLDALAKEIRWFGPGSRIIITTEDLRVLKAHRIKHIYQVDFPSSDEAFQIFCMHAFGQKHPDDGFNELAREVTYLARKLPLGLKVLGSALRGMSKQEWEMRLPRLKTCLNGEIESIIKFSYDALNDEEKYLFLYIACLHSFQISRKVEELLAKQIVGVGQSLVILSEKSLISIDENGRIEMHTLLVQFGIKTSREQFIVHGRAKRQLLVGERDICEVLSDDTTDCRHFIGINLDLPTTEEELNISEKAIETMTGLQFISIYGYPIGVDNSERLHSLLYYSQKIRSLHWENFKNICFPSTFNTESLVELYMPSSKLQKLWDGTKQLKNLKWMDLNNSTNLIELPDLSTATNLQELNLHNCSSLVKLPTSIKKLTSLLILNLSCCSSLVELPSIENATKLERLNLYNCSSLVKLPSSVNASNLQRLSLNNCSCVVKLPTIEKATNLQILDLKNCSSLLELPPFIGKLDSLQSLDLRGCSSITELPSSIGNATNLPNLFLSGCSSLVKLPSSIENLTNLKELNLSDCSNLVELPSIGNATKLEELNLSNCSSLVKLPSSINASNLKKLFLKNCLSILKLPAIENATNLWLVDLNNCSSLLELPPSIGTATKLQKLYMSGCSSLMKLPSSIGNFTCLGKFDLSNCSSLVELPSSIGNLQQLYKLKMFGCSKLEALPTNINLESLCWLDLTNCSQLKSFPEISTNIEYLRLIGTAIKEIPLSIMSWSHLSNFEMSYFESLKEFPHALDIITELQLKEDIQEVAPWVKGLSRLRGLRLNDCNKLVSLPQFSDSLWYIDADNCKSLERLDCSFKNPKIRLHFTNCFKLNQEARDLIIHTSTSKSILPGTQVPACFDYRETAGDSLTIKLNERHLSTSLKFKACIMMVMKKQETVDDETWTSVSINIMDKQNDLTVPCTLRKHYIKQPLTEHIYIYTFEVEAKKVTSTELVFEFDIGESSKWKIKECGLLQILEVNEHDKSFRDDTDGG